MNTKNRFWGIILIIGGIFLILNHYDIVHFSIWGLWPLILVYLGIKAENEYFKGYGNSGKLMTGPVLILTGSYFLMNNIFPHVFYNLFLPILLSGIALGFLQKAYYGYNRKKNYRFGVVIGIISILMFIEHLSFFDFDLLIYIAFIFIGLFLLKRSHYEFELDENEEEESETKHERYPE